MNNLLIAVDQLDSLRLLLGIANRISDERSHIEAVRVVYEGIADFRKRHADSSDLLRKIILESELEKLNEVVTECFGDVKTSTVWHKHRWEGVLEVADETHTDLILKALEAGEKRLFHTPDDWRLLRHSPVPVMFCNKPLVTSPRIMAALDVFDVEHSELNCLILTQARELVRRTQGRMDIVTVYPRADIWVETGLETEQSLRKLRDDIATETAELVAESCRTVGIDNYQITLKEGQVAQAIERVTASADILVMGTKARRGSSAWTLGNTCEKILHQVKTNILVVP